MSRSLGLPWIDLDFRQRVAVSTTEEPDGPEQARLQTNRDAIRELRTNPDVESADA